MAFGWTVPGRGHCQYEVTQIDYPIDCGLFNVITYGRGLNNHGAVVGSYQCSIWKDTEAFLWTPEDGFTTLPRPPGVYSAAAMDINDDGVIVGTYEVADIGSRGFIYQAGQYTEIPPLPGGLWSWCNAINRQGNVVGGRSIGPGINPYNAFVYSLEEGVTDLGIMNGPYSSANEIGPDGQVVGWTGSLTNVTDAFLWEDGTLTLLGPVPGGTTSNVAGIAAGTTLVGAGFGHAPPGQVRPAIGFLWRDGEFIRLIDSIPGYDTSAANDINGVLQVAGHSVRLDNTNDRRAFLWQHGVTHDLNAVVQPNTPSLDIARAINDHGQILAEGGLHTFVLTPVGRPPGDLDIDCHVGITDFLRLLENWGEVDSPADLNGDGTVDQTDFTILIQNWG
jgi:probable HAF family extracellular repeat protein